MMMPPLHKIGAGYGIGNSGEDAKPKPASFFGGKMNEEYLKREAARQQADNCTQASIGGALAGSCGMARPSLRERIRAQLTRAQQEATRRETLGELEYLLDKNPDVARILDLLEHVKG